MCRTVSLRGLAALLGKYPRLNVDATRHTHLERVVDEVKLLLQRVRDVIQKDGNIRVTVGPEVSAHPSRAPLAQA